MNRTKDVNYVNIVLIEKTLVVVTCIVNFKKVFSFIFEYNVQKKYIWKQFWFEDKNVKGIRTVARNVYKSLTYVSLSATYLKNSMPLKNNKYSFLKSLPAVCIKLEKQPADGKNEIHFTNKLSICREPSFFFVAKRLYFHMAAMPYVNKRNK